MRECKGLGARLVISTIKPAVRYLQYAYIYGKQEPHGPLFTKKWRFAHVLQPTDRNTARILVFLDDLLMFYQAFSVNLM